MQRDAEATRKRLLEAAIKEFAAYGIAGARVDRIAAAADSNKAQIYHYYGSKDQLFDAAFEAIVTQVVTQTPLDVHDLPGYAALLAALYDEHPEIMRMSDWQRLERSGDAPVPLAAASVQSKIDEIARAQAEGILPGHYPAGVLLVLVLQLAATWVSIGPEFAAAKDSERGTYVADAVHRLLGR
ncbi:TetR family transcriptional regulator [Acrocarpospora sp. B8E8]|uniref:TetR/AcrR family transcriptional regulator n=1 Tax=Acrocarpospora sp. B8E8 TaxID=3153572 RepID=UPI00325CDBF3